MYDANIYEIVNMYVGAVKQDSIAGNPDALAADRVKIRDYLTNLKGFEGFSGPIRFGPDGDAVKTFFIVQGQNGAWQTKESACSAEGGC
jgi:branched-chain amino acid transport system substrate-binding protein